MKRALRVKSVGTKVSAAELRVLESRAAAAGLTLSEWVRDVLLGSSVEMGTMAAERTILAEVLAMRTILLNFMLKVGEGVTIPEEASRKLIKWADDNKMKRALEALAKNSAREERMQTAPPEPALPRMPMDVAYPRTKTRRPERRCRAMLTLSKPISAGQAQAYHQFGVRQREGELLHGRRARAGRVAGPACRALRAARRGQ